MKPTKKLGNHGEEIAAAWLEQRHFTILAKNYYSRFGEIDIIAQKDDLIVFVEVKTRKTKYFSIATVVNKSKQRKIAKTAKRFILEKNLYDKILRFDIATILYQDWSHELEYIPNAFQAY